MESKHTKGEWKVLYGQFPIGTISINSYVTNERICTLEFDTNIERIKTEANAAHIVNCVNTHKGLLTKVEYAKCILLDALNRDSDGEVVKFKNIIGHIYEVLNSEKTISTPIKQD